MAISKSIKKRNKASADMFKLAKGLKKGGSAKKKSKFPDHSGDGLSLIHI